MQIVIDIPEEYYNFIKNNEDRFSGSRIYDCVLNGTVLPEGHGRLIDADKLKENIRLWDDDFAEDGYDHIIEESDIDDAPTVIEADKEVDL